MKILIVDDHAPTVTFMRMAFENAGYVVLQSESVCGAMVHVEQGVPDIVLGDLTLEGDESGLEIARRLRESPDTEWVGALAVSGSDSDEVRGAVADAGFDGFVPKPVNLVSLLERVEQLGAVVAARRPGQD